MSIMTNEFFKMDLSETGLLMFFKDYQLDAMRALWSNEPMNSREVWEAVGKDRISRASIINFLDAAYNQGLLDKFERTGKGGHQGVYSPKYDEEGTKNFLKKIFKERLDRL